MDEPDFSLIYPENEKDEDVSPFRVLARFDSAKAYSAATDKNAASEARVKTLEGLLQKQEELVRSRVSGEDEESTSTSRLARKPVNSNVAKKGDELGAVGKGTIASKKETGSRGEGVDNIVGMIANNNAKKVEGGVGIAGKGTIASKKETGSRDEGVDNIMGLIADNAKKGAGPGMVG